MIDFMLLGGPRSGTTWAANWLTTDHSLCLHDPLITYTRAQLTQLTIPNKRLGISCTASMLFPDFVNGVKCPKVLIFRNVDEINNSLDRLGLTRLVDSDHYARMDAIKGAKLFVYDQLFRPKSAQAIAETLGAPWDPYRHYHLTQMRVEPMWRHVETGRQAVEELLARIAESQQP